MKDIEMKYYAGILCDALHRNINDNFSSVSFEILTNKNIQIRILLKNKTETEEDYIIDLLGEFEAHENRLEKIEIYVNEEIDPLKNVVFQS